MIQELNNTKEKNSLCLHNNDINPSIQYMCDYINIFFYILTSLFYLLYYFVENIYGIPIYLF